MSEDHLSRKTVLPESPLVFCPGMAAKFGVNEAIFVQQVHYCLRNLEGRPHEGRKWIYNSYAEWHEKFSWLTPETIRKIVSRLKTTGMLLTKQLNIKRGDARLWYTLDYAVIREEFGDVFDAAEAAQGQVEGVDSDTGWGGREYRMGWTDVPDGVDSDTASYIETKNPTKNTSYISTPPTIPPTEPEVEELVGGGEINCKDVVEIKERRDPYQERLDKLPPTLAKKLDEFLPKARERRSYSKWPMQPGEEVWGYADALIEEIERSPRRFSDDDLIYGLDEAYAGNGQRFGYVLEAAKTHQRKLREEGKPPISRRYANNIPPTGRGAPKARHSGMNSSAAAARRREDSEWFFEGKGTKQIRSKEAQELYDSGTQLQREAIELIDGMRLPSEQYAEQLESVREMED